MGNFSSKQPSQRQLKVGEEIRHALSRTFLHDDYYDEETLEAINPTISEVRVSPDLKNATVFFMPLGGKNQEKMLASLERISPLLRTVVGKNIRLRHTPRLTFRIDKSFDTASEMNALLAQPKVQQDLHESDNSE